MKVFVSGILTPTDTTHVPGWAGDIRRTAAGWTCWPIRPAGRLSIWGKMAVYSTAADAFAGGCRSCNCHAGTNDLLQGCTPEKTADRMKHFLQSLPLAPEHILLIAPPPMAPGEWVTDPSLMESSRMLAGYYRELAGQLGVRYADAGNWHITLAYDGVHLPGRVTGPLPKTLHRRFADETTCLFVFCPCCPVDRVRRNRDFRR